MPDIARLNRYILVVTPLQPFVDWLVGLQEMEGADEGEEPFTLEEAQAELQATYLVPYSDDPDDAVEWVGESFDMVFEQELYAVTQDRSLWPSGRTLEVFREWFALDLLDAPIDLVDAPAYLDEPEPARDGAEAG